MALLISILIFILIFCDIMKISNDQLNDFQKNGFIFFKNLFSVNEVKNLKQAVKRVVSRPGKNVTPEFNSDKIRMVHGSHEYDDTFAILCKHPRIIEPAEQILDDKIYIHQSRLNFNYGFGTGGFYWHQDYATWKEIDGLPEPKALMIAIFLDDVTSANGPLMFIPGSHKYGVIDDFEPVKDSTGNVLMRLSSSKLSELSMDNGIELGIGTAGSVLIMHCNLVHGSTENISAQSRTLFYANVNAVKNKQTTFSRESYHAGKDFTPIECVHDNSLSQV